MHNKLLHIAFLLLFFACIKKTESLNAPLDYERMVAIVADIHLAEAQLADTNDKKAKDSLAVVYYQHILNIHKVSAADLEESMQAYFERPEELKNLYDGVENNLKEISKKMPKVRDEREEKEKQERDSLAKTIKTPSILNVNPR